VVRAAGLASKEKNGLAIDNHAFSVMAGLVQACPGHPRGSACAPAGGAQLKRGHDGEGLESHLRESYQACQPIAIIDKHGDEF
jgi:hypothetical protein